MFKKKSNNRFEDLYGQWEYDSTERLIIDKSGFKDKCRKDYKLNCNVTHLDDNPDDKGRRYFELDKRSLYEGDREIGTIDKAWLEGDTIHLIVMYCFGERERVFHKTDKKEFYYYDIVTDEYIKELQGTWKGDHGVNIEIKGKKIAFTYGDDSKKNFEKFCIVRENVGGKRVFISNEDLYCGAIGMYTPLEYKDGQICGYPLVMDANMPREYFTKEE